MNIIRKYIDIFLLLILFSSIFSLFYFKLRFEVFEKKLSVINNEIYKYHSKSNLLEAELVYLSKPERLINLSKQYLKNSNYIDITQIKDYKVLRKYYLANLDKYHKNKIALNE